MTIWTGILSELEKGSKGCCNVVNPQIYRVITPWARDGLVRGLVVTTLLEEMVQQESTQSIVVLNSGSLHLLEVLQTGQLQGTYLQMQYAWRFSLAGTTVALAVLMVMSDSEYISLLSLHL